MTIKETKYGKFLVYEEALSIHVNNMDQNEMWEEHLKPYFDLYAKDKNIVEVGSSAGYHTVYLSTIAKHVYSFEPQLTTYEVLCSNLERNGCKNVTTHNFALYSKNCKMKTAVPISYTSANHSATAINLLVDKDGDIEAKTLDDMDFADINFIKIDAQGCDLNILMGAINTIKKYKPALLFEYESEITDPLDDYIKFIKEIDYNLEGIGIRDIIATPK